MDTESNDIINLDKVSLAFQPGVGVFDLDYSVEGGTIFGLIGPSGCGKTTSVRLMLGLLRPDEGQVHLWGKDVFKLDRETREQLGYLPQRFVLYPELTVNENLRFVASLYGIGLKTRGERINEMLVLVELEDAKNRLASKLSGGMRRRLELAAALLHKPALVFADEPTGGVDPVLRSKIWEYINRYSEAGNTLFITTQHVDEASYCDLVGMMHKGRMVYIDTPENLRRKALGGDVIVMIVDPEHVDEAVLIVEDQPGVLSVQRDLERADAMRVNVDDAGERIPDLIDLFASHPDIEIIHAEKYEPPFDTIFRRLIEKEVMDASA